MKTRWWSGIVFIPWLAFSVGLEIEPLGPSSRTTGLVISEVMYHPFANGSTNNLEYVEIYNSEPITQDLEGFRLSGDVDFTFPPGSLLDSKSFLVVSKEPGALEAATAGLSGVYGPYAGELPNDEGRVRLRNPAGAVLLEVAYSDSAPWPPECDGAGHSLVLHRPSYGEGSFKAWGESTLRNGSPGAEEPFASGALGSFKINEVLAHTDLPQEDFIEIINSGNQSLSLNNCKLSDNLTSNFYTFAAIVLPPGGMVSRTESELGFSLNASGETVYLLNSSGKRVLDAVKLGPTENGVSVGRYPDGAPSLHELTTPTPGGGNAPLYIRDIVINEIMYHPISGNPADEYVELHNKGGTTVDLSGWRLNGAVRYTFPVGTMMAADGFLVVGKDADRLIAQYPQLNPSNCLGNFNGQFTDSSEKIVLEKPDDPLFPTLDFVEVDQVIYGDGNLWGTFADGGGSSLELIDPHADNRLKENWAGSDESGKSIWATYTHTGVLDNGSGAANEAQLILLGEGSCLIDDVSVTQGGGNLVPAAESNFESGLGNWIVQGTHTPTRLETSEAGSGAQCMRLIATAGGDNGVNRVEVDLSGTLTQNQSATLSMKARWLAGHPILLLRLQGNWLELSATLDVPNNLGTPGLVNSRRVPNGPPAIYDVVHSPITPNTLQAVTVTARIEDVDGLGAIPTLVYRIDPATNLVSVAMVDDGTGPDFLGGDGIYSASIPGQISGVLVGFHVEAADNGGASSRFPASYPEREGLILFGNGQSHAVFDTYKFLVTEADVHRWEDRQTLSNELIPGTMIYNNSRVIYHAGGRFRGSSFVRGSNWSPESGTPNLVWRLDKDDDLMGSTFLNLDSLEPGRDDSRLRERMIYRIGEKLNIPFSHQRYVHLYINGNPLGAIYADAMHPGSREYLSCWFPDADRGVYHKIDDWFEYNDATSIGHNFKEDARMARYTTTGGVLKKARYRWSWEMSPLQEPQDDYSPFFELVETLNDNTDPQRFTTQMNALVDMEEWLRTFAVRHVVLDWDGYGYNRGKNQSLYRPENGDWNMLLWDLDFGLMGTETTSLFSANDPLITSLYAHPPFRRVYLDILQKVALTCFDATQFAADYDPWRTALINDGVSSGSETTIKNWVASRRAFLLSQIPSYSFAITTNGGNDFTTTASFVELTGTAPIGVRTLSWNGITYPLTWTSESAWSLSLPLQPGANSIQLIGDDVEGLPVSGATDTIVVTSTGTPVNPVDQVVINELMYNPVDGTSEFIELLNRSATDSFDLGGWVLRGVNYVIPPGTILAPGAFAVFVRDEGTFSGLWGTVPVQGVYPGSLDNGGERVSLVITNGLNEVVVDEVRYDDAAPWPTEADGAGPSLQLIDASQDNRVIANWGVDLQALATPGAVNSIAGTLPILPAVWLNEIMPNNASFVADNAGDFAPWVEIYHPGPLASQSLDDLYLTDNLQDLTRWAFPSGKTLAAGEAHVVWADNEPLETTSDHWHAAFSLNSLSGQVALVLGNGGNPLVLDMLSYGTIAPNRSEGSYPDGDPLSRSLFHFPTPNATNVNTSISDPIFINEWLALNNSGITDPADGAHDDWLELYNPGTQAVDVSGYTLTDDLLDPGLWAIPPGTLIPAEGFLFIWADNESGTNGQLHAGFRLSGSGETIGLFAPGGELIDSVTFGAQSNDVSQGRFPDGDAAQYFLGYPTPAAANRLTTNNTPPVVASIFAAGHVEDLLTFVVGAEDTDLPAQNLVFSLEPGAPAGAVVHPNSGVFSWTPGLEFGGVSTTLQVRVADDGNPPLDALADLNLYLADPLRVLNVLPTNPAPAHVIWWNSAPGRSYQVEFSSLLNPPDWDPVPGAVEAAGSTSSKVHLFTNQTPRVYYRVQKL